ncbi:hypothetical protein A6R68_17383, partial [Neotoma lepida]
MGHSVTLEERRLKERHPSDEEKSRTETMTASYSLVERPLHFHDSSISVNTGLEWRPSSTEQESKMGKVQEEKAPEDSDQASQKDHNL